MNIKLLAVALMVAGTTAGCSDALDRNLNILEGKDTPPEEQQEPTPEGANPNPIPILEEPSDETCVGDEGVFRIWSCVGGQRIYLDSNMNQLPLGVKP